MFGLLCLTPDNDRPDNGVSEFDALFGHIVRSQPAAGVVCYESGGQGWDHQFFCDRGNDDTLFDGFEEHRLGTLVPVAQFVDVLDYGNGFWTDYWLFPSRSHVDRPIIDLSFDVTCSTFYPTGATHMFSNVDGVYWVAFAKRDHDLKTIEQVWRRTRRFEVSTSGEVTR